MVKHPQPARSHVRTAGEQAAAWLRLCSAQAHRIKDVLLGSPVPEERVGRVAVEEPPDSWGKLGRPVLATARMETMEPLCSCWQAASCCRVAMENDEWGRAGGSHLLHSGCWQHLPTWAAPLPASQAPQQPWAWEHILPNHVPANICKMLL